MNNIAQSGSRLESAFSVSFALAAVLTVNTVALMALDHVIGVAEWLKSAAALFLAF